MKLIIIGLIGIGGLFVFLMLKYTEEHVQLHGVHKILGRTLTGRRTDGKRHTNASFWRKSDGKTIGHPVGRVSKRHHRAGVSNLCRTIGWLGAIISSLIGFTKSPAVTLIGTILAAIAWGGYHGTKLIIRLRQWYLQRTYIAPLAEALGPHMDLTGPEMETNIHMDRDYMVKKIGPIGRIDVPVRYHPQDGQKDAIESLLNSRLPVTAEYSWKMQGRSPHIAVRAAPPLPTMVKFSDYISEIEKLDKRQYITGPDRTGKPYVASFAGEEPHHGYCWGSGRGKSSALKSIIAQIFHNEPDATGTIIDPKEVSLNGMLGIPGLAFYNDADDIPGFWEGITAVYDLMRDRYAQLKIDPTLEFATHLLIMEEANSFSVMSKVFWQRHKSEYGRGMPATPPIWADAVAPIFWRGRQVNVFIVLVAQSIQERFLGNINLRPSIGLLSLSGYKMSQWDTYVGTSPRPKPQRGRGRAIIVEGDQETWIQTLYGSDSELKDFAMAGRHASVIQGKDLVIPDTETVATLNKNRY